MFTPEILLNLALFFLFAIVFVVGLAIGIGLYLSSEYESKIKDVAKHSTPF